MTEFTQGQRWVVDSEPELGLGLVTHVDQRAVTLFFEQADVERRYAARRAPLTRIRFEVDDEIELRDGTRGAIVQVHEQDGLLIYDIGHEKLVVETALAAKIRLNQPYMRLMTGQVDNPRWFSFRRSLDNAISRVWRSQLNGLLGSRANLIPHQLYVTWQACNRERVRILLADEVGLGKTIEAGMILARLLKLERIHRVAIFVPDALQVQWLVELVRKFSLTPGLYRSPDKNKFSGYEIAEDADEQDSDSEGVDDNTYDFHGGQIHIIPHSAIAAESARVAAAEFDLLIVDEAHHVRTGSDQFASLADLTEKIPHLVLLTATPEQLGIESHFARLRLLDPAKFTDLQTFRAEEKNYALLNEQIKKLPATRTELIEQYGLDASLSQDELVNQLLDRHGIGRVMFRNVRRAVEGFPDRIVHKHTINTDSWEAKYEWLAQWLKTLAGEKVLVICHLIDQVKDCENYLWQKHGIDSAVFHEEQSLIERDRAAAYFADREGGSQLLLCSEIGSEGRNFQFSCHLVCLDLPAHPDLLEQRIGRLDRIGQTRDVNVHVPLARGTQSEWLFEWYNGVLDCIGRQNPAAGVIHDQYWPRLENEQNPQLIEEAREASTRLQNEIQEGRDALLEMNSCRQPFATDLTEKISEFEKQSPYELVNMASDLLQFHFEPNFEGVYSLIPSDKMLIPALPGLPPEGAEVTFSREIANAREDLLFITWDSPFIEGLWELLHHSELGSASVATLRSKQLPAGHCLLEACYSIVIQSDYATACLPFLNDQSLRILLLDIGDNDLSGVLPEPALQTSLQPVKKHLARQIIQSRKNDIPEWFRKAEHLANGQKQTCLDTAKAHADSFYTNEIERLRELKKSNPHISELEIDALVAKHAGVVSALEQHAHIQLSALRLIVVTP